jgi:hypothetical protein
MPYPVFKKPFSKLEMSYSKLQTSHSKVQESFFNLDLWTLQPEKGLLSMEKAVVFHWRVIGCKDIPYLL